MEKLSFLRSLKVLLNAIERFKIKLLGQEWCALQRNQSCLDIHQQNTGSHQPMSSYELSRCLTLSRMDQSAVGHDYVAKVEKHESQRDYSAGFGGKFGVQSDRQDKVIKLKRNDAK